MKSDLTETYSIGTMKKYLRDRLWTKELVKINNRYIFLTPLCMSSSFKASFDIEKTPSIIEGEPVVILRRECISRFLSFYNKKILGSRRNLKKRILLYLYTSKLTFQSIDSLLDYLETTEIENWDKHLKPPEYFGKYYQRLGLNVNYIDPFSKSGREKTTCLFGDFPKSVVFSTENRVDQPITISDLTDEQIKRIHRIYSDKDLTK